MRYTIYVIALLIAAFVVASPLVAGDQPNYRVVDKHNYAIVEKGPLYIYTLDKLVRKGAIEKTYFFSVGENGDIKPLTILNVKNAFPENHRFHDLLDMSFSNDWGLTTYDKFHNMFKVNRLLIASNER